MTIRNMLRTWRSHLLKTKACKSKSTHALLRFIFDLSENQYQLLMVVSRELNSRLYPKFTLPTELKDVARRVARGQTRFDLIDVVEDQSEELMDLLNFVHDIAINSKDVGSWSVTQNESLNFAPIEQVDESMETYVESEEPSEKPTPPPPRQTTKHSPPPSRVQPRQGLAPMPVLHAFVI